MDEVPTEVWWCPIRTWTTTSPRWSSCTVWPCPAARGVKSSLDCRLITRCSRLRLMATGVAARLGGAPATIADMVDGAERYLDERGLDRPHLAGNSMGGFMAIELARRGRAATVCALSPAGFWTTGDGFQRRAFGQLQRGVAVGRRSRPVVPLVYKSAALRRLILRDVAAHGDRHPRLPCRGDPRRRPSSARSSAISAPAVWLVTPLDPTPCPITIAWGETKRCSPRRIRPPHSAGNGHDTARGRPRSHVRRPRPGRPNHPRRDRSRDRGRAVTSFR